MNDINYPWDEAPTWAQYAATDENGDAYWYENKPILRYSATMWGGVLDGRNCFITNYHSVKFHWKESLQKRPEIDYK